MQQLSEFIMNHLMLFAALLVVIVLLVKAELEHQSLRGLLMSPSRAIRLMNNDETLVLDLRTSADFKGGHIKGAKNVPLKDINKEIDKLSDYKDKPVLVYCNSGSSAGSAIRALKNAGFVSLNNLDGGIAAWKEAKLPLSKHQ